MSEGVFRVKVVTLAGEVYSKEVAYIKCFSRTGEVGIFADHTPSLISIDSTDVLCELADGSETAFFVTEGLLSIHDGDATFLTENLLFKEDINLEEEQENVKKQTARYAETQDKAILQESRQSRLVSEAKVRVAQL